MYKPTVKDFQFKFISIENKEEKNEGKEFHGSALSLLCSFLVSTVALL